MRILDRLWAWLISRCKHDSGSVALDILQSDAASAGIMVSYCRRCGAVRIILGTIGTYEGRRELEWRIPRPLWHRGSGEQAREPVCPTCGGRGTQIEWCESLPVGESDCVACGGGER